MRVVFGVDADEWQTIYLYDIGTQTPYSQRTSGPTPAMRRRFCGGASWPDDRSSFDMFVCPEDLIEVVANRFRISHFFGGLPPYDQEGYGYADAWILSIPSFTWTIVRGACLDRSSIQY